MCHDQCGVKLGINRFFSERQDGISEYEITPELCDRYEELDANTMYGFII